MRTLTEPDDAEATEFADAATLEHEHDRIGWLTSSASSNGTTETYGYDAAGDRTEHTRTGETSFEQVAAYDPAGQLRQTATSGDVDGSASYEYDRSGNRTRQVVDGVATQFGYDPTGRTVSADTDGRSLDYRYGALGRRATTSDTTEFGTQSSTQYWSGMTPSGVSTAGQGAVALVRDVTGELAVQASAGEVSWTLLDRLASTVATTDGSGQLSQLSGYADHGTPAFETTGWDGRLNFTGEPDDPTAGMTAFFARSYDTTTGTFTSRDLWRGLQMAPQTLNRYAYVLNDPATYIDVYGYRIGDPGSYNVKNDAQRNQLRAVDNATNVAVANNRTKTTGVPPVPTKCKPQDPCSSSNVLSRHGGVPQSSEQIWRNVGMYTVDALIFLRPRRGCRANWMLPDQASIRMWSWAGGLEGDGVVVTSVRRPWSCRGLLGTQL